VGVQGVGSTQISWVVSAIKCQLLTTDKLIKGGTDLIRSQSNHQPRKQGPTFLLINQVKAT